MLWLARKAFFGHVPFPCVHVDTSYKIPEMIAFRDRLAADWKLQLVVGENRAALDAGRTFPNGVLDRVACCTALKRDPLAAVIAEKGYEAVIVGIRRDEEGTRAKERYFSPRNKDFEWDYRDQPPEFWGQFQTDFEPGTHLRVHPLLHWTELNVWEYIHRENIPLVSLYFARDGRRYRSLGCAPCTGTVESGRGDGRGDHRRVARDEGRRAQHPRAGSGKRGRLRAPAGEWVYVNFMSADDGLHQDSCGASKGLT